MKESDKELSTEEKVTMVTSSIKKLLHHKNKNYGDAALNPIDIFGDKAFLGKKLDEKLSRIKNSDELRKNDVSDLIGYLILECSKRDWLDFSEFED